MQGKHLYEYAVIRLVPKVEREEFFNVGVTFLEKGRLHQVRLSGKRGQTETICFRSRPGIGICPFGCI